MRDVIYEGLCITALAGLILLTEVIMVAAFLAAAKTGLWLSDCDFPWGIMIVTDYVLGALFWEEVREVPWEEDS